MLTLDHTDTDKLLTILSTQTHVRVPEFVLIFPFLLNSIFLMTGVRLPMEMSNPPDYRHLW